MKKVLIGAAVLAALSASLVSTSASAQVPADRAVKYRQSALTVMATSFGRIGAHIKGDIKLEPAALAQNAEVVELMSKMAFDGFLQGTEQSSGATKAKPEIWKEWDKFKKSQSDLQAATAKLYEASKSGDAKAIQAAFGQAGQACKACHDAYRAQ
jgi:cytochrome c556